MKKSPETWDRILDHEHRLIEKVLEILQKEAEKLKDNRGDPEVIAAALDFFSGFADGCHHRKEERVLFPLLEERGIPKEGGPIGVMLREHEEGRRLIARMREAAARKDRAQLAEAAGAYVELLKGHIWKEDDVLYPAGKKVLTADDARNLVEGFEKIEKEEVGAGVHEKYARLVHELERRTGAVEPLIKNVPLELLDAMLDTLPFEITLVDSEDTVIYFNKENKEKLFSRTRAAIGRKVQQCHPQKSAHLVQQIIDDFKSGRKDFFEFWINVGPRKAYIRYFAIRDAAGRYLGCVGVDQDITEIQKLEGKKRF
ncbi:MAG: PAS domain-containing protein [Desulfotomaculales bacterium]